MAGIRINAEHCVRALSKFSTCESCVTSCPTNAIAITEQLPSLNLSLCVGCGACVGVCPTEALALDDFSPLEFFFTLLEEDSSLVSCRKNIPCLSALHVEYLIALSILKKGIVFDMGHCDTCEIATVCLSQIKARVEEANYVLEAANQTARVSMEMRAYEAEKSENAPQRRDFFKAINLQGVARAKADFERQVEIATDSFVQSSLNAQHIATLRDKELGDKRKLLYTALKRVDHLDTYHVIEGDAISFTSQKLFDMSLCSACQMCYRLCPTGALRSDARHSKIDFDPLACVKCALCHDVCESDALSLSPSYNLKALFEPSITRLATFNVKNCQECGVPFVSLQGQTLCVRCDQEEFAAKELWGIGDE